LREQTLSPVWAILLFLASLALSVLSSIVLARRLEQLGAWLGMSESLLGIVAALGSDAPEISSAIAAMHSGQHDLGVGIVVGSNIFNLAALLGLSALVSGKVAVARKTLVWNGSIALLVLLVVIAQLYGWVGGGWALALIAVIMVPYVTITAIPPRTLAWITYRLGMGAPLVQTVAAVDQDAKRAEKAPRPSYADILGSLPALVAIVVASIGLVRAAIVLGAAWRIPSAIIGTLALAALTSIPNVVTAVQLARKGRGSAVLSESLNSNTLNLVAGAALPSVLLGAVALISSAALALWWMTGMTLITFALCSFRGGLGRKGGAVLIVIYGLFVTLILWRS
jgi:cation:H+ antiporter